MSLTSHLPADRRTHVDGRLQTNLMAWLTTVRANGQPECVPVWFLLQDDDTVLIYSQPGKLKLRNIAANPKVALALDVSDIGRDVIRIDGEAQQRDGYPGANEVPAYVSKYTERIAAIFGTVDNFAASFSVPVLVTVTKLHA